MESSNPTPAAPLAVPVGPSALSAAAAVALGATLLGFAPIGVRLSELGPQATAFWRFAFALPALGAIWIWTERAAPVATPKLLMLLIAAGLAFGADIAFWHASLKLTTVVNATLFSNMTPIVAALGGWLLLRERIDARFALGAGVGVLGAAALAFSRAQSGQGAASGDILAVISAVWYASYLVIMRFARRAAAVAPAMFVTTLTAIFIVAPVGAAFHEGFLPHTARGWAVLMALGLVVHVGGQGLIAYGLGRLPIALSTVLLWLQPLAAAAISWVLFGEALAPLGFLGAALLLFGVWIVQSRGYSARQ
jgi:drug/metabolite transporter (DMT)-like permease